MPRVFPARAAGYRSPENTPILDVIRIRPGVKGGLGVHAPTHVRAAAHYASGWIVITVHWHAHVQTLPVPSMNEHLVKGAGV